MHAVAGMNTPALRGELRSNEPMARHTSWRAGGRARQYYVPADLEDLAAFLKSLTPDEKVMWFGLGSNTLVRDGGYNGTVIATQGIMNELEMRDGLVYVGAGVPCAKLARFCARQQLAEAGFFAGIPGLVGGALAMNAGAFGGETWRHVARVETIDRGGERHQRDLAGYEVGYRSVRGPLHEWYTAAWMRFDSDANGTAAAGIRELLAKRAETQPTGTANCGSVFTNPKDDYAARLIESCDLKGFRIGGAVVSEKHANFIINDGGASAADIEQTIEHVRETVERRCGVRLQTEVRIVGETG